MKNDIEGLAGYVAEMWCYFTIKAINDKDLQCVCDCFGTSIDKCLKIDLIWRNAIGQICHGDVKSSISHPNCSIEANHPFFSSKSNAVDYIMLPFRDEKYIYVVDAKELYEQVLSQKMPLAGKSGKMIYIIKPEDVKAIDSSSWYAIPVIGKQQTFGEFFNANFKGDEIKGMNETGIVSYVNQFVTKICQDAIEQFDVPED